MADEELVPLAEGPGSPAAEESAAEPELTNPDEPMETLTVSLNKKKGGYGFNIKGGRDKPFREGDSSIYITRLRPGATAEKDGRLAPGDKILEINGNDVSDVTHSEALDLVRETKGGKLTLLVQKRVIKVISDGDDGLGVMSIQLHREKKGRGLGFNIRGGRDSPYVPEDPSIYVTRINSEGAAASDGRLSVGDKLLEINNVNVEDTTIDRAIDLIQSKKRLLLLVEKKALQRVVKTVREGAVDSVRGVENVIELYKDPEYGLGFNIRGGSDANYMRGHPGIFVTSIKPGGSADRDSRLKIGDRLLEINGVDVRSVPQDAAVQLVQRSVDKVTLLVEKDAEQLFKNSEFYSLSDFDEIDMSGEAGCFFRDQKRRIDFVLAYEEFDNEPASKETLRYRRRYMKNLQKSQLEFEEEQSPTKKGHLHFIKVHVPWEVMLFYAEELNFKGPLKARTEEKINWSERILKKFHLPNIFKDDVPDQPPNYFTATFQASKLQRFVGSDNPETYFKDTERTRVANEILETAVYGSRNKGEIGISRLVEEGVFTAAYPLHVGPAELPSDWNKAPDGPEERRLSQRQILKEYWARWGKWLKYQPLDHVREYFGEKIGIYFGWLGQYTAWLIPPSFVGLLVFLYGYLTIDSSQNTALEICNSANWTFVMCPLCEEELGCKAWDLKLSCSRARTSYLFDNPATVGYALFVAFWAVFFLEYWKRKEITLAYQWDVLGFEEEEERPRPTFAALAPAVERNPVTGLLEPHFPEEKRFPRIVSGIAIVICMVSLVVLFMVGVIVYKLLVIHPLYENPNFQEYASTIVSVTGSIMNLIIIMILSKVYEKLAYVLNHWEMHRTQTEYEDNLTFKVFVFQFMNFFASIFYIAFFKGKLVGYPGNYTKIFGLRTEQCSPGGCLMELAQQLSVIMIGKQVIGNVQEVLVPEIKKFMKKRKMGVTGNEVKPRWELDYDLLENEGLFGEYLEMVIQFGFVTIFVAAFPLAPFFALANNIFEIRIDSDKMVCDLRRPVAHRAQDIGIWFSMLSAIAKMAVISNAFLIAFTSQFLPKLLYRASVSPDGSLHGYTNYSLAWAPPNSTSVPCRYIEFNNPDGSPSKFYWHLVTLKLGFVILFEHFVFSVSWLIDMLVPDIPAGLDQAIKREAYQAKQIMSDNHGLMGGLPSSDDYMLELET
ncbi:anoctamin-7-like [Pocillopora damicornis]|uniref:anoctamin-7-like n=1 Tax=Pocillopora damicornis TaxID=46731 RepID=UPI000F54EE92|nr:anoctamin-7-like [Pocillopora damicornis]